MKPGGWGWRLFLFLAAAAVLLPLCVAVLWSVAGRFAFPALWPQSFTLRAWQEWHRPALLADTLRSVWLAAASAAVATLAGFGAARVCTAKAFRSHGLVIALMLLPVLLPMAAYTMGLQALFLRLGVGDSFGAVVAGHSVVALPYAFFLLHSGLKTVGSHLEEQALVLGARPLAAFCAVTLPLLWPHLFTAYALCFTISFSQYFITLMLGGGQVQTLATRMVPYLLNGDRTLGAAYSLMFLLVTAICFGAAALLKRFLNAGKEVGH